jgi:hypothetical protein
MIAAFFPTSQAQKGLAAIQTAASPPYYINIDTANLLLSFHHFQHLAVDADKIDAGWPAAAHAGAIGVVATLNHRAQHIQHHIVAAGIHGKGGGKWIGSDGHAVANGGGHCLHTGAAAWRVIDKAGPFGCHIIG